MTRPMWIPATTKDSDTKKFAKTNHHLSLLSQKSRNSNSGKVVLWETSPPSSRSAGFLNKVTIPCPNTSSLDVLACHAVNSISLDSVAEALPQIIPYLIISENLYPKTSNLEGDTSEHCNILPYISTGPLRPSVSEFQMTVKIKPSSFQSYGHHHVSPGPITMTTCYVTSVCPSYRQWSSLPNHNTSSSSSRRSSMIAPTQTELFPSQFTGLAIYIIYVGLTLCSPNSCLQTGAGSGLVLGETYKTSQDTNSWAPPWVIPGEDFEKALESGIFTTPPPSDLDAGSNKETTQPKQYWVLNSHSISQHVHESQQSVEGAENEFILPMLDAYREICLLPGN